MPCCEGVLVRVVLEQPVGQCKMSCIVGEAQCGEKVVLMGDQAVDEDNVPSVLEHFLCTRCKDFGGNIGVAAFFRLGNCPSQGMLPNGAEGGKCKQWQWNVYHMVCYMGDVA